MDKQCRDALGALQDWYDGLDRARGASMPPRGMIAAALLLLERLRTDFSLSIRDHLATGRAQMSGSGGAALRRLLNRFGEDRPFSGEGGRTNRGVPGAMEALLDSLRPINFDRLSPEVRDQALQEMQGFLVDRVREWHNRQRIKLDFDPSRSTWQIIHRLLETASAEAKESSVAQYLVGAKLQQRLPDVSVRNDRASAADQPGGRTGDFQIGDTAFHVTVSPGQGHFDKCLSNLADGLRPYLIVPHRHLAGASYNAERAAPEQIAVVCIETFVSQNLEEQAEFTAAGLAGKLRELLELYNTRVDAIEHDKSLLIDIPKRLSDQAS